jgi:ferredoxin
VPYSRKETPSLAGMMYSLQVAPEDCTGCGICVDVCPSRSKTSVKHKAINMAPKLEHLEVELAGRSGEVKSNFVGYGTVEELLFAGSIGRTDLPGGNMEQLMQSIREQLYVLPDDTIVYSGHGPATTIGAEKKNNPFVRG